MDRMNERILWAIDEFATEGIQITDAEGNYVFCNKAFSAITGIPVTERLGHNVLEVQPDGAAASVLRSGRPVHGHINSSREGVIIVSNASPIHDKAGRIVGVVSIFNDRTSYLKLAQSLKDREEEADRLKSRLRSLDRASHTFEDIIGEAPALRECVDWAKKAAAGEATVLITGESGTGKELFAQSIHGYSGRAEGPFIRVNCPAIPGNLMESELFGHERGAFTGAIKEKKGKFELAQGGSIFLDEIGELDIVLQSKLLRVLQEREVERVGGNRTIPLNVRVIAATNRDLREQVRQGAFRQDLYYRLNVVHVEVPPLRQRRGDIPLLLGHMLKKHSGGIIPCTVSQEAMKLLVEYDWPGNVRELENTAERLLLCHDGAVITPGDVLRVLSDSMETPVKQDLTGKSLAEIERMAIEQAIQRWGDTPEGKKAAAAELKISLSGLYKKLRQYRESPEKNREQGR